MRYPSAVVAIGACACGGKDTADSAPPAAADTDTDADADADADSDSDSDSDTEADGIIASAACTAQPDNTLRYDCAVTTTVDALVRVEAWEQGTLDVIAGSSSGGLVHAITLWGLAAQTTYEFVVTATNGERTSLYGPSSFAVGRSGVDGTDFQVTDPGGGHETAYVLMNIGCGETESLVIADDEGRIVWYEDLAAYGGQITALSYTPDGTIIASVDDQTIVEYRLDGTQVREWGHAFTGAYPHHEVFVDGGIVYALTGELWTHPVSGDAYVVDGVRGWNAAGVQVVSWDVSEVIDPGAFPWQPDAAYWSHLYPNAYDLTHANSLSLDPVGNWLISLKHFHEVLLVSANPGAPDYGQRIWSLQGLGLGDMVIDSAVAGAAPEFSNQHHAAIDEGGKLTLFDNASGLYGSRGVELAIDPPGGRATIIGSWGFPYACDITGSVFHVGDNRLVTCGPMQTVAEFTLEGQEIWTLHAACATAAGKAVYRGIPLSTLWP